MHESVGHLKDHGAFKEMTCMVEGMHLREGGGAGLGREEGGQGRREGEEKGERRERRAEKRGERKGGGGQRAEEIVQWKSEASQGGERERERERKRERRGEERREEREERDRKATHKTLRLWSVGLGFLKLRKP